MRVFFIFLITLIIGTPFAQADLRDAYTIKDIAVSEQAETVVVAQEQAFDVARIKGANLIIKRLTLSEDRANVADLTPDIDMARLMSAAVDVKDEAAGGGVYRGVLSVLMNPSFVRKYLTDRNIPYVDKQAPTALLVPIADGNAYFAWVDALPDTESATLTPFVTAKLGRYAPDVDWATVSTEAQQMGAERAILTQLSGSTGRWKAKLTLLTPAGRQSLGSTGNHARLADLPQAVIGVLENHWKRQNIVRNTGVKLITEADVTYTSLIEWNALRNAFLNSSLVFDFDVLAQNKSSAIIQFTHSPDIARFERDLLQRGVRINQTEGRPKVTSARFGG